MTIAQVEKIYKSTLGFPAPIMIPDVSDAVVALVEDRNCILGLQHQRRNFCGERVDLGAGELPLAVLAAPWPSAPPAPVPGHPRPIIPAPFPNRRSTSHAGTSRVRANLRRKGNPLLPVKRRT